MAVICFGAIRGYILKIRSHLKLQIWGWNRGIKFAAKNEKLMKLRGAQFLLVFVFLGQMAAQAQYLDSIGVTLLWTVTTNVNGAGIRVAQAEANNGPTATNWEVNSSTFGQLTSSFTYYASNGSATTFPNSLGAESSHADAVGTNFYGIPNGVATNVAQVDNYEANFFWTSIIDARRQTNIDDLVVNQSFSFGSVPSQVSVAQQQEIDSAYDDYAAQFKTLFVSGAGNGGSVISAVNVLQRHLCRRLTMAVQASGRPWTTVAPNRTSPHRVILERTRVFPRLMFPARQQC